MSVPSGLDFSNVRHVRVWHEQFEAIKNKGEFLIVEDKTNGKCVSFTRACLKIKNCTKHVFLSPFHDRIKKKGAFICQDVMN